MPSEPLASPGVLLTGAKISEITRLRQKLEELQSVLEKPVSEHELKLMAAERARDELAAQVTMLRHLLVRLDAVTNGLGIYDDIQVALANTAATAEAHDKRVWDELLSRAVAAIGDLRGSDVPPGDARDAGEGFDLAIDRAQSAIRALTALDKEGEDDNDG